MVIPDHFRKGGVATGNTVGWEAAKPQAVGKRRKGWGYWLKRLALLALLAAAVAVGWVALSPLMAGDAPTVYEGYTVERGTVSTAMSFSAAIAVLHSETFSTSEFTTVRAVYVTQDQAVEKGDKVVQLANGDILRATFDGVVNEVRVAAGDWVRRNATLAQVCDFTHLQVSMRVDEYDVEKVSVGQPCTVTLIALGLDFETEIAHINRVSASAGSVAYYTVTAELTVPANVLPGMQATVTIPAEEAADVLTLPMTALAFDQEQNPYVLRKAEGEAYTPVTVETGLTDGVTVEITGGLAEGDTVYAATQGEAAEPAISLAKMYEGIVGKTVIINDMSQRGGGRRGNQGGANTPPDNGGTAHEGD